MVFFVLLCLFGAERSKKAAAAERLCQCYRLGNDGPLQVEGGLS